MAAFFLSVGTPRKRSMIVLIKGSLHQLKAPKKDGI
jgi:hypothetical protein